MFPALQARSAITVAFILLFLAPGPGTAAESGSLTGRVLSVDDAPVTDAVVEIVDLHRRSRTDEEGRFRFEDLPAGSYLVWVESRSSGSETRRVSISAGEVTEITIRPDRSVHGETIVVTTGGSARSELEVTRPVSVLGTEELMLQGEATLGETLSKEPGITSTYFGPGASTPVIRGLTGDRVRTLQSGLGTGDASSVSPDHAVTAEPLGAERIEIIRGPATLLYGSNAIGGVVNVLNERIPRHRPVQSLEGSIDLRGGSVSEELAGSIDLTAGAGDWVFTVGATGRETDDYEIPGFATVDFLREEDHEHEEDHEDEGHGEEEEIFGVLPNSDLESREGSFGLSYLFGEAGSLGVSVTGFESEYGIPGGGHEHGEEEHGHEEEGEEGHEGEESGAEGVRIDMENTRIDLRGEISRGLGPFQRLVTHLGFTDYEHDELEGEEIGTSFSSESWEGRLEMVQRTFGPWSGSFGLQAGSRDLVAVGEEAFIPGTERSTVALFGLEEYSKGDLRVQLGGRYEQQDTRVDRTDLPDRDFDGLSASLGLVWNPGGGIASLGTNLSRSVKMPAPEELYSDGLHAATQAFEIGNPGLGEETSLGVDGFVRVATPRWELDLTVFATRFDDFIFQRFTGEQEEGFPVVVYAQQDADFHGAEMKARLGLVEETDRHLDLELFGDLVRAELDDGQNVPRIPPLRLGGALSYRLGPWSARTEVRWVDEQDELAVNETPTDGYTMVGASVGYRLLTRNAVYDLLLRGRNLTDEEARSHTSFLKDRVPLPGRDVSLSLRIAF
ncbi:MAG: TonB-dependent receptor [Thermoanaerobaculia bacterium]|nr:TonB-dependent receptor [Thermoanaerobaculia bacterium]